MATNDKITFTKDEYTTITRTDNPDTRNAEGKVAYYVRVYFKTNREHMFPARDLDNARDIAARCVREHVWIIHDNGEEEFFPPVEIHKVKIVSA